MPLFILLTFLICFSEGIVSPEYLHGVKLDEGTISGSAMSANRTVTIESADETEGITFTLDVVNHPHSHVLINQSSSVNLWICIATHDSCTSCSVPVDNEFTCSVELDSLLDESFQYPCDTVVWVHHIGVSQERYIIWLADHRDAKGTVVIACLAFLVTALCIPFGLLALNTFPIYIEWAALLMVLIVWLIISAFLMSFLMMVHLSAFAIKLISVIFSLFTVIGTAALWVWGDRRMHNQTEATSRQVKRIQDWTKRAKAVIVFSDVAYVIYGSVYFCLAMLRSDTLIGLEWLIAWMSLNLLVRVVSEGIFLWAKRRVQGGIKYWLWGTRGLLDLLLFLVGLVAFFFSSTDHSADTTVALTFFHSQPALMLQVACALLIMLSWRRLQGCDSVPLVDAVVLDAGLPYLEHIQSEQRVMTTDFLSMHSPTSKSSGTIRNV